MDILHQPRTQLIGKDLEIKNDSPCTSNRSTVFSNYIKANFVKFSGEKLRRNDFNVVIRCPMEADKTIIKTALTAVKDASVNVFADDTDILSLLSHHRTNNSTDMYKENVTISQMY